MIDRTRKPIEQLELKFHPPEIEFFTLDNGLNVYFIKRSHLPVLRINLIINAGSKFDPPGKKGLANLLTMTFDEGAGNLNGLELSDAFEMLGSNFDTGCNQDNIFLSLRSLKENFKQSLQLFSDVLLRPHLDDISFAREKRKILTRVLQLKDDSDEIANQVFDFVLFGKDDPYAYPVPGFENTIANIICEDVRKFYQDYVHPGNASLIAVGDVDKNELTVMLNEHFKGWERKLLVQNISHSNNNGSFKIYLVDKKDSVQSEIRAGHLSEQRNPKNYMAKLILNAALGGQFSSRINLNLREDKGYTYGAASNFSYLKDSGYFIVSTSVGKENTANALTEILKELRKIKDGITPEELSFTRSSIFRKFPSNFETNRQIAVNVSRVIIHSLPLNHFDNYPEQLNSVTIEDVHKTALEAINPEILSIVIVGDKNTLMEQLEKAGYYNITELDYNGTILTNAVNDKIN